MTETTNTQAPAEGLLRNLMPLEAYKTGLHHGLYAGIPAGLVLAVLIAKLASYFRK